jgi:U3 small nucleolar RNA-associated protein 14
MVYGAQSKELSRWVHVFQENRQAETIDFKPKQRAQETRETMVDKFQVRTNFEKELEEAFEEAGQQDEEAIFKAEEQIL